MNYIAKKLTELKFEYHLKMVDLCHTSEGKKKHRAKAVDALQRLGIEVGYF